MARGLDWLYRTPIAHRGLHDDSARVIENSISAARAAIARGYAIECDVQLTRDGEAIVFHDDSLERLTSAKGRVDERNGAEIGSISLGGSIDRIPFLAEFLGAIGGKTPLVIELKSRFDGDLRLARRVCEIVSKYDGPFVIESFDPDPIAYLREEGCVLGIAGVPLGVVAQARYDAKEWLELTDVKRAELTNFLHYSRTRPDFLSWRLDDLPNPVPLLCREGLKIPVTVWTVRSRQQADFALRWADQVVFEGFFPQMA